MSTQDRFQIISFDILWSSDKSYDNVVETFDFHDPPLQLMRWVELSIVSFMTCSRAEALPLSRNQVRKGVDSRVTLLIVLFGILPLIAIWNKLVRGYYVLRAQFNRGYLKWHSSSNRGWMDENTETLYGKMRGIRLPLGGPASLSPSLSFVAYWFPNLSRSIVTRQHRSSPVSTFTSRPAHHQKIGMSHGNSSSSRRRTPFGDDDDYYNAPPTINAIMIG